MKESVQQRWIEEVEKYRSRRIFFFLKAKELKITETTMKLKTSKN